MTTFPLLETVGDMTIRLLRDAEEDYELLARWLSDERVLEFYSGRDNPFDYAKARQEFGPRAEGRDRVVACIIEKAHRPLGYIQFYALTKEDTAYYALENTEGVYGIDLFIGEPSHWNRGLGTQVLFALTQYLFEVLRAVRIVIDPQVTNARAIRSYEKCGFKRVQVVSKHEFHEGAWRDCWLMVKDRS